MKRCAEVKRMIEGQPLPQRREEDPPINKKDNMPT